MKKPEAESAIRYLCHEWAKIQSEDEMPHPSFSSFTNWLYGKNYGHYLEFRSTMGPLYDAEMWFDQELQQTWRR